MINVMKGLNGNEDHPKVVVVMVPLPAQGHLNPLLHLAHLITSYNISVHFVGSSTHNHQAKARLQGREAQDHDSKIHFHDFQLPPFDPTPSASNVDLYTPPPSHLLPLFKATNLHLREHVYHLLQQLSVQFSTVIVIHDILTASVVQDLKLIPNVEAYTFITTSAFTMFLDALKANPGTPRPFQLDLKDVISDHITSLYKDCSSQEGRKFAKNEVRSLGFESGWLYNTSRVIEQKYINLLEKLKPNIKHFAIGPLNPIMVATVKSKHQCLEWLDKQEKDSVMYVSFGSTTSLTDDQVRELAYGLDQCGQKFIWVIRKADAINVFDQDNDHGYKNEPQLPKGYEDKVRNKGIVVRDWAPQLEILAHTSVGGFMSHCGWNSCMESISMGVPIAAWPMYSDQPRNCFLVSDVLRVGVVVRDWARRSELVTSNVIENAVKVLMVSEEGKEMKKRAVKLGAAIRGSVAQGSASCIERDAFIAYMTKEKINILSRY